MSIRLIQRSSRSLRAVRPTAALARVRTFTSNGRAGSAFNPSGLLLAGAAVAGAAFVLRDEDSVARTEGEKVAAPAVDYAAVKKAIADILDVENYDDGSYGPLFIRLAWHAAGTYDKNSKTGGSDGATMRFAPESTDGANAGLKLARDLLEPIKKKFPGITYSDLWTLAGVTAIEEMGGPQIPWRPGRRDAADDKNVPANGRLPDAAQGEKHVRDVFYRMGFNDQEIVALLGAHTFGRCHTDRSGYSGPWTRAPTTFSNEFFKVITEQKWTEKKWNGPKQYEDPTKELMMLPADLALVHDPEFKKYVDIYAKNEEQFRQDFAKAFSKLLELGVKAFQKETAAPAPAPAKKEEPKKEEAKPAAKKEEPKKEEKSWWQKITGK